MSYFRGNHFMNNIIFESVLNKTSLDSTIDLVLTPSDDVSAAQSLVTKNNSTTHIDLGHGTSIVLARLFRCHLFCLFTHSEIVYKYNLNIYLFSYLFGY